MIGLAEMVATSIFLIFRIGVEVVEIDETKNIPRKIESSPEQKRGIFREFPCF